MSKLGEARKPVKLDLAARPNIIFFLVDDYDKPETSVCGGSLLTPNLDRMAREGMVSHTQRLHGACPLGRRGC